MARLIIKNGYIKGGSEKTAAHLNNLVKYIATRDGVEKIKNGRELWYATKKQTALVKEILREFPDTKELFEYEDYLAQPNRENASEFITIALEQHLEKLGDREKYLDYIANRPRVEKLDSHGLFTGGDEPLNLNQVADEISAYTGNVWIPIISLRREDAAKLGYDNAHAWKALLSSKAMELAENLKIHPDHLKWYAAFHNESHHPHVHMICYSTDPGEGYLTKNGILKMKSSLAQEIFRQELIPLYGEKTERRDQLKEESAKVFQDLIRQMKNGVLQNDRLEQLIMHLAERLQNTSGKKQYGYLKAELKNVVDKIVDELAQDNRVAEAYRLWWEIRSRIETVYTETPSEPPPLSRCEDFKPIRNMVIKEAMHIGDGTFTFEEPASLNTNLPEPESEDDTPSDIPIADDEGSEPEYDLEEQYPQRAPSGSRRSKSWWTKEYKLAKKHLYGDEDHDIVQDFEKARFLFLSETEAGNPLAMYDLGRICADGLGCEPDLEQAHQWYSKALAAFQAAEKEKPWKYTEYRIGKMVAAGLGTEQNYEQAADWLTQSANEDYKYAQYSLGGLYYHGKGVEQNREHAFQLYTCAADQDFPYASFELGKMLRDGIGCSKNSAESERHFSDAFLGFINLEKQSHDDKLQYRLGWMLLHGVGTEKDIARVADYLEKSAGVGNPFACYQLAKMILSEENPTPAEVEKALAYIRQSVEAENPYAAYFLGKLYQEGRHIPQDIAEEIRLFQLSAEQGNEFAAYRLGKLYLGGEDVPKDVDAALRWLTFAADSNNQFAQYTLGTLYLKGNDVPQDFVKAMAYLKQSAAQGFAYASFELGKMLRDGNGCEKNGAEADWHFRDAFQGFLALEKQNPDDKLQYRLGWMLLNGVGTEKDVLRAKEYLEKSADAGNSFACYQLAKMILSEEKPVPEHVEKALLYLRQAAEAENPYAQYLLGKLYQEGRHVPKNIAEAVRLFQLSAAQDNDFAAYRLGKLYLGGEGVLKDMETALHWLNFAADKKNQFAEYAFGLLYLKGEDIPKDAARALEYLNRSAIQGNSFAQYRLGKMYLSGEDVPKDLDTVLKYLNSAADQGNQFAQYTIGKLYLTGQGVPKDKEAAVRWFALSAAQGNIYAQFFLDHMDQFREPSILLAGTRLLHHLSRIFADNAPPLKQIGLQIDRKRRLKLNEKKRAAGHARDDHEPTMSL
jgi:TPR repeat protein